MAKKVTIVLIDDISKESTSETVAFALDGISCEIDLSVTYTNKLHEDFRRWAKVGRRVQGRCCRGIGVQIDCAAREYNRKMCK